MDIRYTLQGRPGSFTTEQDDLKAMMEDLLGHLQEEVSGAGLSPPAPTFASRLYNRYFDTVDGEVEEADLGELGPLLKG